MFPPVDIVPDFTVLNVSKYLRKVKIKSATAPGGFPGFFWNKLRYPLSFPLSTMFSLSFNSDKLPSDWKLAYISPVYKKVTHP